MNGTGLVKMYLASGIGHDVAVGVFWILVVAAACLWCFVKEWQE